MDDFNTEMQLNEGTEIPDDEEIEKHLDLYQYEDVMKDPLRKKRGSCYLRPV